jgi:hypothetical protein
MIFLMTLFGRKSKALSLDQQALQVLHTSRLRHKANNAIRITGTRFEIDAFHPFVQ